MAYFMAGGIATTQLASAGVPALNSGILSAQLLSQPAVFGEMAPGAPLALSLQSPYSLQRTQARENAATDATFQAAVQLLDDIQRGVDPAEGTAAASLDRARAATFVSRLQREIDQALAQTALGDLAEPLRQIMTQHPELATADLATWRENDLGRNFIERVKNLYREQYLGFSAFRATTQLPGTEQVAALENAVRAIYGDAGQALLSELAQENLSELLQRESLAERVSPEVLARLFPAGQPPLTERYQKMGHMALFARFVVTQRQFMESLVGSPERVELFWTLRGLELEMSRRDDFESDAFKTLMRRVQMPDLSPVDRSRYFALQEAVAKSGANPDPALQAQVTEALHYFSQRTGETDLATDAGQHFAYRDVVQQVALLALRVGVSAEDIRRETSGQGTAPSNEPVTLQQIYDGTQVVTLDALPPEIKDILRATGQWDLVNQATRRVILMPEIASTDYVKMLVGSAPSGRGYFADGTLVISTAPDGLRSPVWRIAGLIAHEAAHLRSLNGIMDNPQELMGMTSNVPQEREAYAWESKFYRSFLSRFGSRLNDADRAAIEQTVFNTESIVYATNLLLSHSLEDLEPGRGLQADLEMRRYGGLTVGQLDINSYPERLRDLIGRIEFSGVDGIHLSNLRSRLRRRIEDLERALQASLRFQREELEALRRQTGSDALSPEAIAAFEQQLTEMPDGIRRSLEAYRRQFGLLGQDNGHAAVKLT